MAKKRARRPIESGKSYTKEARAIRRDFTRAYKYKSEKALLKAYKKFAKMADQRLVRLEKAASQKGFENILSYAYRTARENIKAWDIMGLKSRGRNAKDYALPRFNRNIPLKKDGKVDINALKSKMTDIERFLISVTSTQKGVRDVYQSRADKINKKYRLRGDARLTWEDMQKFWGSESADKLREIGYGSDTIVRAIASIKRHKKYLTPDQIKDSTKNIKITKNPNVNYVANQILQTGLNVNDIFAD